MLSANKAHLLNILEEQKGELAEASIKPVIKRLLHFVKNDYVEEEVEGELIVISQRYTDIAKDARKGIIDDQAFRLERNKVTNALIAIIKELKESIEEEELIAEPAHPEEPEEENIDEIKPSNGDIKEEYIDEVLPPPSSDSIVLRARELRKKYKRNSNFELHLEALELELGTITVLVGENATGKTTLIRLLTGELAVNSGELDYPLLSDTKQWTWAKVKQQIAYIPQFLPVWHRDLYRSLCYEAVTHGVPAKEVEREVDYIVHRLGLAAYLQHQWGALSGGYKLRYALAKALVWHPRLLIIDEPLAHLDIRAQLIVLQDLRQIVDSLSYPIAILLSSQHIHEVEHIADHILFMQAGEVSYWQATKDQEPDFHYFEFACSLDKEGLKAVLAQLPHTVHKIQYTGLSNIIQTDTSLTALALQQFLNNQGIALHFFRDISQSIKTKFYEQREA